MEQSPSGEANSHSASPEISDFMEPEMSLPCSVEPATGPYRKLDESKPKPHILFLLRSILILSSNIRLGLFP